MKTRNGNFAIGFGIKFDNQFIVYVSQEGKILSWETKIPKWWKESTENAGFSACISSQDQVLEDGRRSNDVCENFLVIFFNGKETDRVFLGYNSDYAGLQYC